MRRKYLRRREGFTLIELLIVLAIIGALMAIGIPIYSNALESANATTVASNIRTIADGVRTSLSLDGTATQNVGDYIQLGNDSNDYSITITEQSGSPPSWKVEVSYTGNAAPFNKIYEKLSGCNEATYTANTNVKCSVLVTKTF